MRVGQNPIKSIERIAPPAPVTVVVISYIPFLGGYYADSLELLKLCLGSLWENTEGEYDLMLFDNGSCSEVQNYLLTLQAEGRIQWLTLSERNLGKAGAWNLALAAAPGAFVAYADSDVFFYPGWLQASVEVLKAFPKAGMVTAMPILTPEKYSTNTIKWAKKQRGIGMKRGELLPWENFWRHARSLGDTEKQARRFYSENESVKLSYRRKRYYVGAAHFQFMAPKSVLRDVLPIPAERPMGRVRLLDEVINTRGYLRLSTETWFVQHLGNVLPTPGDFIGTPSVQPHVSKRRRNRRRIWGWAPLRRLLQGLFGWSFEQLHNNSLK